MSTLKNFDKFPKEIDHTYIRQMYIKMVLISWQEGWSPLEFAAQILIDFIEEDADMSQDDEAYYIATAAFSLFAILGTDEDNFNKYETEQ